MPQRTSPSSTSQRRNGPRAGFAVRVPDPRQVVGGSPQRDVHAPVALAVGRHPAQAQVDVGTAERVLRIDRRDARWLVAAQPRQPQHRADADARKRRRAADRAAVGDRRRVDDKQPERDERVRDLRRRRSVRLAPEQEHSRPASGVKATSAIAAAAASSAPPISTRWRPSPQTAASSEITTTGIAAKTIEPGTGESSRGPIASTANVASPSSAAAKRQAPMKCARAVPSCSAATDTASGVPSASPSTIAAVTSARSARSHTYQPTSAPPPSTSGPEWRVMSRRADQQDGPRRARPQRLCAARLDRLPLGVPDEPVGAPGGDLPAQPREAAGGAALARRH